MKFIKKNSKKFRKEGNTMNGTKSKKKLTKLQGISTKKKEIDSN